MPKLTIREQIIKGLLAKGAVELKSRSKYRLFTWNSIYYFVGSNGALRYNMYNLSASESKSLTKTTGGKKIIANLIEAGQSTRFNPDPADRFMLNFNNSDDSDIIGL